MRKVVLLGIVLLSVAAFSFLTATPNERPESATVQVSGRLTLNTARFPRVHVVGITQGSFIAPGPTELSSGLDLRRACYAEFPGTRVCDVFDVESSMPPPAPWPDAVIVTYGGGFPCLSGDGRRSSCSAGNHPVLCCQDDE
jgi:hypothetical protein